MKEETDSIDCVDFQSRLAALIAAGEDLSSDAHLRDCANCRALLADLEAIAEAARQMFPEEEPPDTLWARIESAIEKEGEEPGPR